MCGSFRETDLTKHREMPAANTCGGFIPLQLSMDALPTAINAITARTHSISIDPYPIILASPSLLICLDVVPDEIKLWNPEIAPQATVTNRNGNIGPILLVQEVNASSSISGLVKIMPIIAARIMKYSRKLFR